MTPFAQTVKNQRLAAAPSRSAFVMANAGSGKTRVLTNRVARLLLAGAPPQKILCITFTKAAAAEMAERLFDVLGEWALLDDDALSAALAELEGAEGAPRSPAALAGARRLFARALETPGGLKIQTIHSFCESVLRRFPLEAGAPPGFAVIEEDETRRMATNALDALARRALEDETLGAAMARLSAQHTEQQLRDLLGRAAHARPDASQGAVAALAAELGVDPGETEDAARGVFLDSLSVHDLERACDALAQSGGNPAKIAAPALKTCLEARDARARWAALQTLFMTAKGTPRDKIATNATDKIDPWAKPFLKETQERFAAALARVKRLALFHDTAAYYQLTQTLADDYAAAKAARAALDFDDLIARAEALFANTENAWVMYKLDYGVDHILIDEAQDTSPAQWRVIEALFADYLSGGAREENRTFFAVGDMKQSIYSFQGADVSLFREKEQDLGKRLGAVSDYINAPLTLSFRTSEPTLSFVDALFDDADAAEGLGEFPIPRHGVRREGEAGLVELWPLTPRPDTLAPAPWEAPVDQPGEDHPVKTLSARVAKTVGDWLRNKTPLETQGRPIAPGDVMILVQSRGPLFEEIIRRLAQAGAPVAGADRLRLLEDPAVEDLMSCARWALSSGDDLSLAEVLKSPLFGLDDDADLFPLAHERAPGETLWAALSGRAAENATWEEAAAQLRAARSVGLTQGPYAFLSHMLETGAPSGRRRFYARLTESSRDAIDEMLRQALAFENANPRSLRAFTRWFETNAGDIKREMERAEDAVRVMTVHGAKGLEANIVFLIDAHRGPQIRSGSVIENTVENRAHTPHSFMTTPATRDVDAVAKAVEEKKRKDYEEYRRLLYVAATRARDRLYICGVESGADRDSRGKATGIKSWHALAQGAFDRLGERAGARLETGEMPFWDNGREALRRFSLGQSAAVPKRRAPPPPAPVETPSWLFTHAEQETAPPRLAPSRLAGEEDAVGPAPRSPAYSPTHAPDRYFRGRTLHRLLELLPDVAAENRQDAAERLLARLAPEIGERERAAWRGEALSILNDPVFAPVFAPGSRAEVAVAGAPKGAEDGVMVSGQIDRLAIDGNDVLIVDYKTNRPPPQEIGDADPAYIAQLAAYRALLQEIYPNHQIRSALVWTYEARLMPVPDAMLDHAFARILRPG